MNPGIVSVRPQNGRVRTTWLCSRHPALWVPGFDVPHPLLCLCVQQQQQQQPPLPDCSTVCGDPLHHILCAQANCDPLYSLTHTYTHTCIYLWGSYNAWASQPGTPCECRKHPSPPLPSPLHNTTVGHIPPLMNRCTY